MISVIGAAFLECPLESVELYIGESRNTSHMAWRMCSDDSINPSVEIYQDYIFHVLWRMHTRIKGVEKSSVAYGFRLLFSFHKVRKILEGISLYTAPGIEIIFW